MKRILLVVGFVILFATYCWADDIYQPGGGGLSSYPGSGVVTSTGSAWGTSGTGTQYYLTVWGASNVPGALASLGSAGSLLKSAGAGANPAWTTETFAAPGAQYALMHSDGTNWTRLATSANVTTFLQQADFANMRSTLGVTASTSEAVYTMPDSGYFLCETSGVSPGAIGSCGIKKGTFGGSGNFLCTHNTTTHVFDCDTDPGTYATAANWGGSAAAPPALGTGTPAAATFTTIGAGAAGFAVDADGDVTGKTFATPSIASPDDFTLRAPSVPRGVTRRGPAADPTNTYVLQYSTTEPVAKQIEAVASVASHVATMEWVVPALSPAAGQVTFTGPTAARSFALPDAAATIQVASACTALASDGAATALTVTTYTNCFTLTVDDNEDQTITFSGAGYAGQEVTIIFTTAGSADEVITFHATLVSSTGTLTLGTDAGKFYVVKFISNGSHWYEVSRTAVQT